MNPSTGNGVCRAAPHGLMMFAMLQDVKAAILRAPSRVTELPNATSVEWDGCVLNEVWRVQDSERPRDQYWKGSIVSIQPNLSFMDGRPASLLYSISALYPHGMDSPPPASREDAIRLGIIPR